MVNNDGRLEVDPCTGALGLGESLKYLAGFGGADGPLGGEAENRD